MRRTVQWLLVGAIVLDIAYWSIWSVDRDVLASEHRAAYHEFENAFPLADLWLGVACLLARLALRSARPSATFWLTAAGSAGLYLFGMDFLYDVQHGIFTAGAGGVIEAAIVAVTLVFSLTVLRFAWGTQQTGQMDTDARTLLLDKKAELEEQMAVLEEPPGAPGEISFGKRIGEGTSIAVDRLSQVAVHDKLQVTMVDVERALVKLDEDTYGTCDACGRPIPEARLDALPWATLCVEDAAKR